MGISLDQINSEADKRFAPFVVEGVPGGDVVLRNVIRLSKNERARFTAAYDKLQSAKGAKDPDAEDMLTALRSILDILAVGDGGKRLAKEVGDDPGRLMVLFLMYAEDTQLGEALGSVA